MTNALRILKIVVSIIVPPFSSLPHAEEDGSAACTLVELIGRACLRVESEIAQEKQREGDASTVSRFIDAFNSSWPGDDMCFIGRSLLNMIFESATVSLRSKIRSICVLVTVVLAVTLFRDCCSLTR